LSEASATLAQKMYAEEAEAAQNGETAADGGPADGDTVDAEFEEVDEKDDK